MGFLMPSSLKVNLQDLWNLFSEGGRGTKGLIRSEPGLIQSGGKGEAKA